jgi:hypothetical protein
MSNKHYLESPRHCHLIGGSIAPLVIAVGQDVVMERKPNGQAFPMQYRDAMWANKGLSRARNTFPAARGVGTWEVKR